MENSKASETPKQNIKELLVNNFAFLGLILVLVLFEILTGGKLFGTAKPDEHFLITFSALPYVP